MIKTNTQNKILMAVLLICGSGLLCPERIEPELHASERSSGSAPENDRADKSSYWYEQRYNPAYQFLNWMCKPPLRHSKAFPGSIPTLVRAAIVGKNGYLPEGLWRSIFAFSGAPIMQRMRTLEHGYIHDLLSFLIMVHNAFTDEGHLIYHPGCLYLGIAPWLVCSSIDETFPNTNCFYTLPDLLRVSDIVRRFDRGCCRTQPPEGYDYEEYRLPDPYLRDLAEGEWRTLLAELQGQSPELYYRVGHYDRRARSYYRVRDNDEFWPPMGPIKYLKSEIASALIERLDNLRVVVGLIYQYTEGEYDNDYYEPLAQEFAHEFGEEMPMTGGDLNPYFDVDRNGLPLGDAYQYDVRYRGSNSTLPELAKELHAYGVGVHPALHLLAKLLRIGPCDYRLPFADEDVTRALRYVRPTIAARLHEYWTTVGKHKPQHNMALHA